MRCFEAQTYEDRELIVVFEDLEEGARALLQSLGPSVRLVFAPLNPKAPLGALRNLAIGASTGDYVCSWDDDDWHSPLRLETQLRELEDGRTDACLLQRWLVLDALSGRAYVSGYREWEGSLLCRRQLGAIERGYPPLDGAEDRALVKELRREHWPFRRATVRFRASGGSRAIGVARSSSLQWRSRRVSSSILRARRRRKRRTPHPPSNMGAYVLQRGATYTIVRGAARDAIVRFQIASFEVMQSWCSLQDPYAFGSRYVPLPGIDWGTTDNVTCQVRGLDGSIQSFPLRQCIQASHCACDESGCTAKMEGLVTFDLQSTPQQAR